MRRQICVRLNGTLACGIYSNCHDRLIMQVLADQQIALKYIPDSYFSILIANESIQCMSSCLIEKLNSHAHSMFHSFCLVQLLHWSTCLHKHMELHEATILSLMLCLVCQRSPRIM